MKIGIVGLGLIGASLGRLMTSKGHIVYGTDKNLEVIKKAILIKAIKEELSINNAKELDMLIIAVYPRAFKEVALKYLPHLKDGAILSDICGNKRIVLTAVEELYAKYNLSQEEIDFIESMIRPMDGGNE